MACSECLFESSRDCPLTRLLRKTHEISTKEACQKETQDIKLVQGAIGIDSKENEAEDRIEAESAMPQNTPPSALGLR